MGRLLKILLGALGVIVAIVIALIITVAVSLRADIPSDRLDIEFDASIQADPEGLPYLLFGATRGTGLEVARLLRGRGEKVTAFVRPSSDLTALNELGGVKYVVGDGMDPEAVAAGVGAAKYRAVVSTIGCLRCDPPPDFEANKNIIDAMVARRGGYMVLITTIGAGDSADTAPLMSRLALRRILPLKDRAEEYLRASGLDYTIIRPGGLGTSGPTGHGILTENPAAFGFIYRKDLAQMIVAVLDNRKQVSKKTLTAIDGYRKSPWDSGSGV